MIIAGAYPSLEKDKCDSSNIRLIEEAPLVLTDKVNLLLVYAKQKPATEVTLLFYNVPVIQTYYRKNRILYNKQELENLYRVLRLLELPNDVRGLTTDYTGEFYTLAIATTEDFLTRIVKAYENFDHYELGKCFGFPETAIEAFIGKRPMFNGFIEKGTALEYFTSFAFSADNYKEELESTSLRWQKTIEVLSPILYELTQSERQTDGSCYPNFHLKDLQ